MQDLTLDLFETEAGLDGRLTYATELFDAPRIHALVQRYITLLRAILAAPETPCARLNTLPEDQHRRVVALSRAAPLAAAALVPERIAAQAARSAAAPALAEGAGPALSYGQMMAAVGRRAQRLRAAGLRPGGTAAVLVDLNAQDQGRDLIVSLLAIWRAGGIFLPLNAEDPAARLAMLARDSAVQIVLAPAAHRATADAIGPALITGDPAPPARAAARPKAGPEAGLEAGPEAGLEGPGGTPEEAAGPCDPEAIAYLYYTSGTTGRPKPVPVTHGALAAFTAAIAAPLQTGPHTRVLSAASPLFDAIFMDLAASLAQGGLLIRLTARQIATPGYLAAAATAHDANYIDLTPTVWRAALAAGWTPPAGTTAVTGGEAMDAALAARITAEGATLVNSYGPTEATVVTVAGQITPEDIASGQIPIGAPLPGTQALILTPELTPAAPGTPGELYLAGPQLAAGYPGRPGQTARAFIAHPDRPGARLYRTGDLAAWRRDGRLVYLGRRDAQIKLRGMRVELAEIDAALQALPGIQDAAAALQDGQIVAAVVPDDGQSVAAVVPDGQSVTAVVPDDGQSVTAVVPDGQGVTAVVPDGQGVTAVVPDGQGPAGPFDLAPEAIADLRAALAKTLPAHMRPAAIVALPALPVTAAGKIDRRALPALGAAATAPYAAPEGALETAIAAQIADLLREETGRAPPRISRHDSFFALGGHSLMAVRLIARLHDTTGLQLPLRALFEATTLKDLAQTLRTTKQTHTPHPIAKADRTQPIPLSYAQERLWFVERFSAPGSIAEVMGFDLNGPLDVPRLARVFAALYARHEALRLRVEVREGAPVQVFAAHDAVPWTLHDLQDRPAEAQDAAIAALRARPVDPAHGAFRVDLVQTAPEAHTLVLAMHHMIYDGVSLAVILHEVQVLWAAGGSPAALPAPPRSYADYAVWQRNALRQGPLKEGLERFAATLANPPQALALPADRPRPDRPSHAADHVPIALPADLTQALRRFATAQKASLFMVLQTALAVLLAREARTRDIVIGTVAAGRAQAEIETAVGPFFNMIALRHDIQPDRSFTDTLAAARAQALSAFDDQLVPFEAVIARTVTQRDARTAVSPLFQVLIQLHTEAGTLIKPLHLGGLTAKRRPWDQALADAGSDPRSVRDGGRARRPPDLCHRAVRCAPHPRPGAALYHPAARDPRRPRDPLRAAEHLARRPAPAGCGVVAGGAVGGGGAGAGADCRAGRALRGGAGAGRGGGAGLVLWADDGGGGAARAAAAGRGSAAGRDRRGARGSQCARPGPRSVRVAAGDLAGGRDLPAAQCRRSGRAAGHAGPRQRRADRPRPRGAPRHGRRDRPGADHRRSGPPRARGSRAQSRDRSRARSRARSGARGARGDARRGRGALRSRGDRLSPITPPAPRAAPSPCRSPMAPWPPSRPRSPRRCRRGRTPGCSPPPRRCSMRSSWTSPHRWPRAAS